VRNTAKENFLGEGVKLVVHPEVTVAKFKENAGCPLPMCMENTEFFLSKNN
jgi:hypothetical protein